MGIIKYLRRHRKNDDRPYAIGGMTGMLMVLIFGIFTLTVVDGFALRYTNLAAVISSVLVDLANSDRTANKIGGLTVSPVLTAAAQAKADDMAAKGYFAHVGPDGKNSWYWFKQANYPFIYAGENLAVDFSDSQDVESAWMNSPTHRANILNGHFTEIGIATAQGTFEGHPTTFVVQMFGQPAPAGDLTVKTIASPANATEPALASATTAPVKVAKKPSPSPVLGASAQNVPAPAVPAKPVPAAPQASWWAHLLASPKTILFYAYCLLGLLLLVLLGVTTRFEFKQHHLRHAFAAIGLIVLMTGLFTVASFYFFSAPVLAAPETVTV